MRYVSEYDFMSKIRGVFSVRQMDIIREALDNSEGISVNAETYEKIHNSNYNSNYCSFEVIKNDKES